MVRTAQFLPLKRPLPPVKIRRLNQIGNISSPKQERKTKHILQKMGTARNWFNIVRKKFIKSSQRDITILHSGNLSDQSMIREAQARDFHNISASSRSSFQRKPLTREDIAAIKIQSIFRGHLARRAYGALRSLVKLQAVARGAYVRKQAQIAMNCMHALVRLQVKVRARQLLGRYSDDS
ncbi:hypothetical protein REPUB_Repub10bG0182900 [Reevesia pubescens]